MWGRSAMQPKHVVVIDDDSVIGEYLRIVLQRNGCGETCFDNAREALDFLKLSHQTVDLVIVDLVMPHLTGEQLANELNKLNPRIPVILITGDLFYNESERPSNIRTVLLKPIVRKELLDAMSRLTYPSAA